MPPKTVRTLRDLLFWQYAKIIAQATGMGKYEYPFVQERYQKLKRGEIPWDSIRAYAKEREHPHTCIYCDRTRQDLTRGQLLPRSLGGPEDETNTVWVCRSCKASKGDRRPYEWWAATRGLDDAKYHLPRIAEGKYLKLLYELFDARGLLDVDDVTRFCDRCSMKPLCREAKTEGTLEVLCLDGIAGMGAGEAG